MDVGEIARAVTQRSPLVAEVLGEVMTHLLSGEVPGGGGVREERTGSDGLRRAVRVGGNVGDDDVIVELRFEVAVRGVAVLDRPHAIGGDSTVVVAHFEPVVFEVRDPGTDAEVERLLDDPPCSRVRLHPSGADRLLPLERGVVRNDNLRLRART